MLRLFSLPDWESPGIRCQMTAQSSWTCRVKAGIIFLRQEMGRIRKIKRKASQTANGKAAPNCILLRSLRRRDLWRVRLCVWSESQSSIIHFSFCHLLFLGKNCKFQGFWWVNFPLHEKMRRTKGQRWDKVGLSRMRNGGGLKLTIRREAKCIKCERNDNMGDRAIHNLLIILKCLLGRYRIDNWFNE